MNRGVRIPGHGLRDEGAPFVVNQFQNIVPAWEDNTGVAGYGRGVCQCGKYSPLLESAYQRKQWHREHKQEILMFEE